MGSSGALCARHGTCYMGLPRKLTEPLMAKLDRRWLLAALLGGASGVGWLAALLVDQGVAQWLTLPEDAELADLEGGAAATASAAENPEAPSPDPGPGQDGDPGEDMPPRDFGDANGFGNRLSKEQWVEPIVRRNIFDSSKVGQDPVNSGEVDGEGRRSDLKVVLLATIVAFPEIYSSALIADEDGSKSQGYGVGDELAGEATIFRIEQKKVFIRRNDGALEYLDMESGGARSSGDSGDGGEGGVSKSEDNKFTVERSLVEQALANPESLAGQVRVTPHKGTDGAVDGYRLSGIRRGSVFEKLGIKNGDIIHTVNGKALTSTSDAMNAYQSLQNESSFSFEITRRSKRQTMEYQVQ